MSGARLVFPERHAGQVEVLGGRGRFNVLCCGRRWGKSLLGLDLLVAEPGGALDGFPVAWFAPNGRLFDQVWRDALVLLSDVIVSRDSHYNRLGLVGGGVLEFWTLHNTEDPGRSRRYSRVFVDEAAMVPSGRLLRVWSEAIRPTLADLEGDAWFASTPKGLNDFWGLSERGLSSDERWADWRFFRQPTSANPFIAGREIEAARVELDDATFRQEFLAEFVQEFGAIFKEPRYYDPEDLPVGRVGSGCDFAYGARSGDWTVFVRGVAGRGVNRVGEEATLIFVTDVFRERVEPLVWGEVLREFPNALAFVGGQEAAVLDFVRERFGSRVRVERAVGDKLARARPVQAAWNRGEVLLPRVAPWRGVFEREVLSFTGDSRVDEFDDCVDALGALFHVLARPLVQLF